MKNKSMANYEAISELGLLSAALMVLKGMSIFVGDPLASFQYRINYWSDDFNMLLDIAAREIRDLVRKGRKLNKVIFLGYESILMDKITELIDPQKEIIVIPNSPFVNFSRIEMNHNKVGNFSVEEIYRAWEIIGNAAIVFVPFFELQDGSYWVYRYCSPILNELLYSKARTIIGIKMLSEIQIEQGYDQAGSLLLLAEANPIVFRSIISLEPKTSNYEPNHYSYSV
jgi:hypothetical protein